MKTHKDLKAKASGNIADRLTWCTAQKDQVGITEDLASGKDIPEVYGLGEAGLFDEFFCFLDTLKISNLFNGLNPNLTKRQSNIKFPTVLLIYLPDHYHHGVDHSLQVLDGRSGQTHQPGRRDRHQEVQGKSA